MSSIVARQDRTRAGKRRARRLVELYNARTPIEEIGRLTRLRPETVLRKLRRLGVPIDTANEAIEGESK